MLPAFIESLIRRWTTDRTISQIPALPATSPPDHVDPEIVRRTTAFWFDAVRFVGLDDLIREHGSAPEITIEDAEKGCIPRLKSNAAQRPSSERTERESDVVVAIGLAPQDWFRLRGKSSRARYLLAIPARRDSEGNLIPPASTNAPFFNPSRIQSNDQRNDVFITTHEAIGAWMGAHALPNAQEWIPLWNYAISLLTGALSEPVSDIDAARETLSRSLGFTTRQDWIVKVVPAAANNQAINEVVNVYRSLLEPDEKTGTDIKTYERLVCGWAGRPAFSGETRAAADAEVLGHIDAFKAESQAAKSGLNNTRDLYPLDPSQRQAVRHACRLGEGEILALNGPPGTGKTATLRAVIASYWVRAALTQKRPLIIAGCGATNQAVTNITEAFIDAAQGGADYALAQRWNPFVSSYGMFFASENFAKENADKIRRYQGFQKSTNIKDRCLFSLREGRNPFTPNELSDLKDYYLQRATQCPEIRSTELIQIVAELRSLLKTVALDVPAYLRQLMASAISGVRRDLTSDRQLNAWVVPLISRQNPFARNAFASFIDYVRDPSPRYVTDTMEDAQCDHPEAARLLAEMLIDLSLRPHAFHIAARYWEGRFLEASALRLHSRSEENLIDALQRVCMLAPCIVSTINSLPKLFAVDHKDPDRPRNYAYGAADLLIMDESGQAVPEAGAACFALTKRALVVGDLKQLEPVANIQPQNEIALLAQRNALQDYDYLVDTFKAPSSGSVLGMAQRASSYHDALGNGLTLLFHYRCVKPIIEFCNRLSYGGRLKAKTNDGADQWPPPLAWVEISHPGTKREGSWVNDAEADEIAAWLRSAWARISAEQSEPSTIDRVVAVLSAFKPQIKALRKAIGEAFKTRPEDIPAETVWPSARDIEAMTIGTVHSLQGAERPIVIFSGAVSAENTPAPFFDSSASILNVAVSRAKKSFIFFGDPAHLFRYDRNDKLTSAKPSAILGDHIRTHPLGRRLYPLYLVIVEAPGKRQVIADILGKDYFVFATGGAIREIGEGDLGLGMDRGLVPRWRWRERADRPLAPEFAALAAKIASYEHVYIATDADMEGEAIAWHITEALAECGGTAIRRTLRRVRLGDITRPALLEAFAKPGVIDVNIAAAAIARAIADRLIADRLQALLNRPGSPSENEKEARIAASFVGSAIGSPKAARPQRLYLGRVQAGILRVFYDEACKKNSMLAELGRFRITVRAGGARGYLILPEQGGKEYRIDAADLDFAHQRLEAIVNGKLPQTTDSYEHDGLHYTDHDIGPPRFLSTIEIMRRAVGHGLLPWDTMQALQNLYLGQIMKDDYLGEIEA